MSSGMAESLLGSVPTTPPFATSPAYKPEDALLSATLEDAFSLLDDTSDCGMYLHDLGSSAVLKPPKLQFVACSPRDETHYGVHGTSSSSTTVSSSSTTSAAMAAAPKAPTEATVQGATASTRSTNRNAIMAKRNREKKKRYVQDLEEQNKQLQHTVMQLSTDKDALHQQLLQQQRQIEQLQATLASAGPLTQLLQSISSCAAFTTLTTSSAGTEAAALPQADAPPAKRALCQDVPVQTTVVPLQLNLHLTTPQV